MQTIYDEILVQNTFEAKPKATANFNSFVSNCVIEKKSSATIIVKRIIDIIISSFVIAFVLSWFTPLVAIIIYLDSKDKTFFTQLRNGLNMKPYVCYKFTTMHKNDDAHERAASQDDIRITKVGKFLRISCLDELPQFFNVLKGEMSIVGPRPHMIADNEKFELKIHGYNKRHFVKPGITGLAQIKGYKGPINSDIEIYRRVENDVFYTKNYSIAMDLKIILKTITHILKEIKKFGSN
jgi:putative colanic acid biosynthesis UDP-glucose lipid carrier transferase